MQESPRSYIIIIIITKELISKGLDIELEVIQFFKSTLLQIIGYEEVQADTWKLQSSLYINYYYQGLQIIYEKDWTDNIPYSLHHFQLPLSDKGAVDNTIGLNTETSKLFLSQKFAVKKGQLIHLPYAWYWIPLQL